MKRAAFALAVVVAAARASAQAPVPRVVNASVEQRAVSGALDAFVDALVNAQTKPAWIGYQVPAVAGHYAGCCGSGESAITGSPCYLEGRPSATAGESRPVKLEGDRDVLVLFRVESGQVGRIALFSPECELDAGGLRFFSLTGVQPADSVRLLSRLARATGTSDRVARTAVTALALHGDPSADAALQQLVAPEQPMSLRTQAALWLGSVRGARGFQILRDVVERDASPEFRRQATLALSRSAEPGAVDSLLRMAKADPDASVRGQALFWLAQKAGKQAVSAITDAIQNDPESQVKERAVFALSQLPKDEGVPLLINVARSNRDPKVRARAMFWLGQSKDPRAVAFFEEILKGK
jgi:hypothetical protein